MSTKDDLIAARALIVAGRSMTHAEVQSRGIYSNVAELSVKLVALRQDMADAGFFKTYQALDVATKALGWEAAEQLERTP